MDHADHIELERDLAAFYDQQVAYRHGQEIPDERIRDRNSFIELLQDENRASVVEVGAGVGKDAVAMIEAGLSVSVIDISSGNVAACQDQGIDAHVASATSLPFDDDRFEAGFTVSSLLHLDDEGVHSALNEFRRVTTNGAPLAIGVWGGPDRATIQKSDTIEPKRRYWYRSDDALRKLLEFHGTIESFRTWEFADLPELHYQFAVLRTGHRSVEEKVGSGSKRDALE